MKPYVMASILVFTGLYACKPAAFKSVEDIGEATPEAADSQDAVADNGNIAVVDEAIEATEVSTTDTRLQLPEAPVTNADEVKIACNEAKAKGTLKSKAIPLMFPAKTATCDFEKNDNLSRKNGLVRARLEEFADLPLNGMTRLCNMKFDAPKQNMKFDDEIVITLNNLVVASSQDYSTKAKNKNDQQVYPNGLVVDADGLVTYKWLAPNGLQNLEYLNGKLTKYCLGLDPKKADFDQLCQIPKTDTNGTMQLILPQDAFLKLAAKGGLVFDKQIQAVPKARLGFLTTGDDNDSDCQHLDFQMTVTVDYVP